MNFTKHSSFFVSPWQDSCQEWCRNWSFECSAQRFPGCVIRRLAACTGVPHREGNSMGGLPLFNAFCSNNRADWLPCVNYHADWLAHVYIFSWLQGEVSEDTIQSGWGNPSVCVYQLQQSILTQVQPIGARFRWWGKHVLISHFQRYFTTKLVLCWILTGHVL